MGPWLRGGLREHRPVVPEQIQGLRSGKRREEDTEGELNFPTHSRVALIISGTLADLGWKVDL